MHWYDIYPKAKNKTACKRLEARPYLAWLDKVLTNPIMLCICVEFLQQSWKKRQLNFPISWPNFLTIFFLFLCTKISLQTPIFPWKELPKFPIFPNKVYNVHDKQQCAFLGKKMWDVWWNPGDEMKGSSQALLALNEPSSPTHFTEPPTWAMNAASRLGLAASQLDLAAAQLVVLSVGFRSPRELGKF